ncbi:hypothetical protein ALMP_69210 [Streptomyces sp. A012304]|nr:hypothetical protein ALMP_69210 [Streptomyces sp. A012304]
MRAPSSVKGWGTAVQAVTCSSFIISARAGTSSSSRGRSTNRSVLMEMVGKVLVMRRSVTFETSGAAELPSMQHESTELHHGVDSE